MNESKRQKQMAAKRAKKEAYGQQHRSDEQRKQLNPRVPYQRRKLNRLRGGATAGRPVPPWWSTIRGMFRLLPPAEMSE